MKLFSQRPAIAGFCLAIALSVAVNAAPQNREGEAPDVLTRVRRIVKVLIGAFTPTTNNDQVTLPKP